MILYHNGIGDITLIVFKAVKINIKIVIAFNE